MEKQSWNVDFYKTEKGDSPVEAFILGLTEKEQVKALYVIQLLQEHGPAIRHTPHSKSIVGESNLFELRIKQDKNIYRIFYFHYTGQTFVLLHGFTKKSQETPRKEIETALKRRKDYEKRN